jgi:hypothetical protein
MVVHDKKLLLRHSLYIYQYGKEMSISADIDVITLILEAFSQLVQNQNAVEDVTCLTLRPSKWSAICVSKIAEVGSPYSAGGSELFIGNSC